MSKMHREPSHRPLGILALVFCSLSSILGVLCLIATLVWTIATGRTFSFWVTGWNDLGEGLRLVSALTVPLALMVLPLDKKRGLIGLLGAIIGFVATATAYTRIS